MSEESGAGATAWVWLLGLLLVIGVGVALIWLLVVRPAGSDTSVPSPEETERMRDPDAEEFSTQQPNG